MTLREHHRVSPGYPRDFRIAGRWINSYKVLLCIGVYAAIMVSAAVAAASGISPLRFGTGLLLCAVVGMSGARVYHLATNLRVYRAAGLRRTAWNTRLGGWSIFGGLVVFPFSLVLAPITATPMPLFWDHMALAIVVGGPFVRFGCVCNGCCVGRASNCWYALWQHDLQSVYKPRVPVQWLEIGWWLLAGVGLIGLWPYHLASGSYALGVLAWYGIGRFWLEPLRETTNLVYGSVRVDRIVAAVLALAAGGGLLHLTRG